MSLPTQPLQVRIVPVLADNLVHLLADAREAVAVDPGDAAPVLQLLEKNRLRLQTVLLTHRHADHTIGAGELRRATRCRVAGPAECAACGLDRVLADGDTAACGTYTLRALATPGHTAGHMAYGCEAAGCVWTGDALFLGGCGRVLEGSPAQMWQTLCRLRALPAETAVYCGHDYTLDNLEFAAGILPDDPAIGARLAAVRGCPEARHQALTATIGEEGRSNIFLRADDGRVRAALGLRDADPVAVFAELRRRKDAW